MTEITSLPTDNLYKLYALAGISLTVISLGFLFTHISDIKIRISELQTQADIFEIEEKALGRAISTAEKMSAASPDQTAQLRQQSDALLVKRAQIGGQSRQVQVLVSELRVLQYFAYGLALLGFFMSAFGFRLWLHRVQLPNDALLRRQLERRNP